MFLNVKNQHLIFKTIIQTKEKSMLFLKRSSYWHLIISVFCQDGALQLRVTTNRILVQIRMFVISAAFFYNLTLEIVHDYINYSYHVPSDVSQFNTNTHTIYFTVLSVLHALWHNDTEVMTPIVARRFTTYLRTRTLLKSNYPTKGEGTLFY